MKKYLIIILALLSACGTLKKPDSISQTGQNDKLAFTKADTAVKSYQSNNYVLLAKFKGDTLKYMQTNFVDNKQKYIGKDLNTLLNALELAVKSYVPCFSTIRSKITPNIMLEFYSFEEVKKRNGVYSNTRTNKYAFLNIEFSQPLPTDSVMILFKKNKTSWTAEEQKYFGKQIVKDIVF